MRRLSLILLICASIGIALAQSPPLRLTGRPLPLPADWESVYEPAEVLFLAKAESDSSLSLVRVLDGKIEMEPLLREHLTVQTFSLSADSLTAGQELPVILDLSTELQSAALQAARDKQLQADIEGWITRQREGRSFRQPQLSAQESILQNEPEAYRAGFFSYSRPVATTTLQVQGFQPQASIFAPALYHSYYHALLDPLTKAGRQDWTEQIYPYHVALSDIEVGLGDFEHRFARGAIQKNALFGVDRLYLAFAFLVQGGYWLEQNSSLNLLKLALSIPMGVTSLDLNVMDHNARQSMLTLQPEYWQGSDFRLERRYRTVTAAWRNPWLEISLFNENDTAHAERFLHSLHNDALHLRLARDIKWNAFALSAHYERLFTKRNFELRPANHQDLAALKLSYTGQKLVGEALAELYDWQLPALRGQIGYRGANMEAGAFYQFRAYPASPQSSTGNIYSASDPLYRVD
ncbi:MAG TPA: hypothetical protein PKH19_05010, partial [Candidatus Syntrophosphaera sp.]|nr:hypothetical protein [Candidatus Syntrophosphaera sp.]